MVIVKSSVELKGYRGFERCVALVDTGAAFTVIDRGFAEALGVIYTGRERSLTSATGHKLKGEIAVIRELTVEGEILDYEKVLVVKFNEEVKKALSSLGVHPSITIGVTTMELASLIPDITTGKGRLKRSSSKAVSSKFKHHIFTKGFVILEVQPGHHEALIMQAFMALYALIQIVLRRWRRWLKLKLNNEFINYYVD